jgi:hypothetical protein
MLRRNIAVWNYIPNAMTPSAPHRVPEWQADCRRIIESAG